MNDPYREPCNIRDVFEGKIVAELVSVFAQITEIKRFPIAQFRGIFTEDNDDPDTVA